MTIRQRVLNITIRGALALAIAVFMCQPSVHADEVTAYLPQDVAYDESVPDTCGTMRSCHTCTRLRRRLIV